MGISPVVGVGEGLGDGVGDAVASGVSAVVGVGAGVLCEGDAAGSEAASASTRTTPGTSSTRFTAFLSCSWLLEATVALRPEKVTVASTPSAARTRLAS